MVEIRYQTRTPSGGTVDRVEAFVDGAKIGARGLGMSAPGGTPTGDPDGLTLPMPAHDAVICSTARRRTMTCASSRVRRKRRAAGCREGRIRKLARGLAGALEEGEYVTQIF